MGDAGGGHGPPRRHQPPDLGEPRGLGRAWRDRDEAAGVRQPSTLRGRAPAAEHPSAWAPRRWRGRRDRRRGVPLLRDQGPAGVPGRYTGSPGTRGTRQRRSPPAPSRRTRRVGRAAATRPGRRCGLPGPSRPLGQGEPPPRRRASWPPDAGPPATRPRAARAAGAAPATWGRRGGLRGRSPWGPAAASPPAAAALSALSAVRRLPRGRWTGATGVGCWRPRKLVTVGGHTDTRSPVADGSSTPRRLPARARRPPGAVGHPAAPGGARTAQALERVWCVQWCRHTAAHPSLRLQGQDRPATPGDSHADLLMIPQQHPCRTLLL